MTSYKTSLILILLLLTLLIPTAGYAKEPSLIINEKLIESDVSPQLVNNRILVPIRIVSESMGAKVSWDNAVKTAIIEAQDKNLKLKLNNKTAFVGDNEQELDVPPKLIANRVFVPLRFIGENLGSEVSWDNSKKIVAIKKKTEDKNYPLTPTPNPIPNPPSTPTPNKRVLTDCSYNEKDGIMQFAFKITNGENKIFTLSNPNRLIIDLVNAEEQLADNIQVESSLVSAIRIGEPEKNKPRIVLDLKKMVSYEVNQTVDTLTLTLKENDNQTTTTPPAQDNKDYSIRTINSNSNVIVIDPGHGGKDVGAIGVSGRYEKDISISIALKLKSILVSKGFEVKMTREDDTFVSLPDIAAKTNQINPFVFVSVHANKCATPSVTGIETYTYYGTDHSLANLVHNSILARTKQNDRKVKESGFYVIKYATVPAILIETGFTSNVDEENLLHDPQFQNEIANGIAEGLVKYKEKITGTPMVINHPDENNTPLEVSSSNSEQIEKQYPAG